MSKTTQDIDVFTLSSIQDRLATIYHEESKGSTYMYVGSERYEIPQGTMALSRPGEHPLKDKFIGFRFREDLKLEGFIKVCQFDEHYLVVFATEKFTEQPGEPDAVNDVILLRVGNALTDVDAIS